MIPDDSGTLVVRSPEGIEFPLRLAGPMTRCLAWVLDILVVITAQMTAAGLFAVLRLISFDAAGAAMAILNFVLFVGYGIWLEWRWGGQTLGKRLFRLRVLDARGLKLTFSQIAVRNLLRAVDVLPLAYLVGGLSVMFTRRAQRLGDLAAGTIVVREPRVETPDLEMLTAGRYNSFREHPHLEARLRQRVTPAEASLVLQAVLRRDEFDADARVALFREMAERFRARVPFPPGLVEDLTDEQFVRNLLDSLHRRPGPGS